MRKQLISLLGVTTAFTLPAHSEEDLPPLSSAYFLLGKDTEDNRNYALGLDIETSDYFHVRANTFRTNRADELSSSYQNSFGLDTNPYKTFSFGLTYEDSSQENRLGDLLFNNIELISTLETQRFLLHAGYNTENWKFGLAPGIKNFTLSFSTGHELEKEAQEISIYSSYFGLSNWGIHISYFYNDVSEKITKSRQQLQDPRIRIYLRRMIKAFGRKKVMQHLRTVKLQAVQASTSPIEEEGASIGFSYYFDLGSIDYSYQQSRTIELFNEYFIFKAHNIALTYALTDSIMLEMSIQSQSSDNSDRIHSFLGGLNIFW